MGNVLHIYDKPVVVFLVDEANSTLRANFSSDVPEDLVKSCKRGKAGKGYTAYTVKRRTKTNQDSLCL